MTRDHEPAEFAAARQPTDAERQALDAIADKIRTRSILGRLRPTANPDTQARAGAVAAHLTGGQP